MKKKLKSKFASKLALVDKLKQKAVKTPKIEKKEISLVQLAQVLPTIVVGTPKILKMSKRKEILKFAQIREMKEFQENPFLSIQTHLLNNLAQDPESLK